MAGTSPDADLRTLSGELSQAMDAGLRSLPGGAARAAAIRTQPAPTPR